MVTDEYVSADHVRNTFYSLSEYADAAQSRYRESINDLETDRAWRGASLTEAASLARTGWDAELAAALTVAEDALTTVERDHEVMSFRQEFGVTGSDVDIARYLSGVPENMIDYPMTVSVQSGRVITLCASMSISGSVSPETIMARGQVITAFALALSKLGYSLEAWLDFTAERNGCLATARVLVKGPNDSLDPSKIQFAFAHPAVLRALGFAWMHGLPARFRKALGVGAGYGQPCKPDRDLPDGTIYIDDVLSSSGAPNVAAALLALLRKAGVIED